MLTVDEADKVFAHADLLAGGPEVTAAIALEGRTVVLLDDRVELKDRLLFGYGPYFKEFRRNAPGIYTVKGL